MNALFVLFFSVKTLYLRGKTGGFRFCNKRLKGEGGGATDKNQN